MLKAEGLYKSYNKNLILKGVNIELDQGEVVVLIGKSGAGKTTLIRNLALLDFPDEGIITLDDEHWEFPLKNGTDKNNIDNQIYPKINIIFQQLFLWPHLTNIANIELAYKKPGLKNDGIFKYLKEELELESFLNNYPNQSSVGQKQRIAITRAIMSYPDYLLMDEVTSALDMVYISKVIRIIRELKRQHRGIILIAHQLNLAEAIADKVYFIDNGSVLESGDKTILRQPNTEQFNNFLKLISY